MFFESQEIYRKKNKEFQEKKFNKKKIISFINI